MLSFIRTGLDLLVTVDPARGPSPLRLHSVLRKSALWTTSLRSRLATLFTEPVKDGPRVHEPLRCETPAIKGAEIAAVYSGARVAGDFYEVLKVGHSRVLFVMLDIAGRRADTREILCAVQKTFRTRSPELFAKADVNEASAMIQLSYEMNRTIMEGGVRSCPGFIGCYNEELGTICYANAGHTPGLLRDQSGISLLIATGLPLGLFSHSTQGANIYHLGEESALLLVSRGVVDAISCRGNSDHCNANADADFGMGLVKVVLENACIYRAYELCLGTLRSAQRSAPRIYDQADLTTLALVRSARTEADYEVCQDGTGLDKP